MAYEVLARKWRPQSFDTLVGQPHVSRTLTNAIEADRLAHAYIFSGLRGVGKTTVARLLAKAVNCEKGPTADTCGECPSCREIAEGSSMDVVELDAATHTGVDDVAPGGALPTRGARSCPTRSPSSRRTGGEKAWSCRSPSPRTSPC